MFKLVLAISLVLYSANAITIPTDGSVAGDAQLQQCKDGKFTSVNQEACDTVCSGFLPGTKTLSKEAPSSCTASLGSPNKKLCCMPHINTQAEGCMSIVCLTTKPPTTLPPTTKPPTTKPPTTKPPTTKPPTTTTTETTTCFCDDTVTQCANNRRRLSKLERAANRRQLLGKGKKKKKGKNKGGKKKGKKGGSGLLGCGECDCDKTQGPNGKMGMVSMTLRWAGSQDVTIKVNSARRRLGKGKGGGGSGGSVTCETKNKKGNGLVLSTGDEGDCRASYSYSTNSLITVTAVGGGVICTSDIHTSCSQDIVGSAHCGTDLIVSGWSDGADATNYCDDGWKPCPCSDAGAKSAKQVNMLMGGNALNFDDEDGDDEASDFEKYGVPIIIVLAIVAVIALGVGLFVLWKRRNAGKATFQSADEEVEMEMDMEVDVETKNITQ